MKLFQSFFGVGLFLVPLSTSAFFISETALAKFTCGPHLQTYMVRSLDERQGEGVRCVAFSEGENSRSTPLFAWYGEGDWDGYTYRHLGHSFGSLRSASGYASDFYGNGEDFNNNFPGNLKITTSGGAIPSLITVKGAWNEVWRRLPSGVHLSYTSTLGEVKICGNFMSEFKVSDKMGVRSGAGVRCVLKNQPRGTFNPHLITWFGKGYWERATYAHLGTWAANGNGAADICEPTLFTICNVFTWGSLNLVPAMGGFEMLGAWSEVWN